MKWMLRTYSVLAVTATWLVTAGSAEARELCPAAFANLCKIKIGNSAGGIVGAIMVVLIIIAAITSLIFLILGGARYITAAGDQGKTAQARSQLIGAIVGLVISLSAFFIVNLVLYVFTGKGMEGIQIPKL